jgi:RND family efflux transporter MFP subunit
MLQPFARTGGTIVLMFATIGVVLLLVAKTQAPRHALAAQRSISARPMSTTPDPGRRPTEQFVGVVVPKTAVDVTAELEGHVEQIDVRAGDSVRKGSIVAVITSASVGRTDVTIAESDFRLAEADSRRAEVQLEQARSHLRRAKSLSVEGLIAGEQLEEARYQEQLASLAVGSAQRGVEQKRAVVAQKEALLTHLVVRAPFDGAVSVRYVDVGSMVSSGTPLVRLVQTYPLRLRFAIPSERSHDVGIGMTVTATLRDMGVSIPATIESISPEIDSASQVLVAEALLNNVERRVVERVMPGESATVAVETNVCAKPQRAARSVLR